MRHRRLVARAAVRALQSGAHDVGLVVGFDKHPRGAFQNDPGLVAPHWYGEDGLMVTTQFFGAKLQRYMHDHAIDADTLARSRSRRSRTARSHPRLATTPLSADEILDSPMLAHPLTQYMLCSPGEGARRSSSAGRSTRASRRAPVWLRSVAFRTRRAGSFEVFSPSLPLEITPSPTVDAAREAFEVAGVEPADVDVVQVQDTESGAELIHLAECGLCEHGEQASCTRDGATSIDGRLPVNTDGGCLANGEPVGASGLRQVYEIVTQLRGEAGPGRCRAIATRGVHARLRRARCQRVHRAPVTLDMTEFWRMGATLVPVREIGRSREFEASGWDGLAVGRPHGLLPDPYATLGLAAAATTTPAWARPSPFR